MCRVLYNQIMPTLSSEKSNHIGKFNSLFIQMLAGLANKKNTNEIWIDFNWYKIDGDQREIDIEYAGIYAGVCNDNQWTDLTSDYVCKNSTIEFIDGMNDFVLTKYDEDLETVLFKEHMLKFDSPKGKFIVKVPESIYSRHLESDVNEYRFRLNALLDRSKKTFYNRVVK